VAPDPFWNSLKITLLPAWERISDFSAHTLVTIPCMLYRLLKWVLVPKTADVTGDRIKLNSNEFQNSYFSLNFIRRRISRHRRKNEEYV